MAIGNLHNMKHILGERATEYLLSLLLLCKNENNCTIDKEPKDSTAYYFQLKYLSVLKANGILQAIDRKDKIYCELDKTKIAVL